MFRFNIRVLLYCAVLSLCGIARADDKTIQLDDNPRPYGLFNVAPDGKKIYFSAPQFLVFDDAGNVVDKISVPNSTQPKKLFPLPNGWFISVISYFGAHVALARPDGTEAKVIITKGGNENQIRADSTGVTSPTDAAIDYKNQRLFLVDQTIAPIDDRKIPSPDWSRIAIFDLEGKYIGDINRYNAAAPDAKANDSRRGWYTGIAVDPTRQRVYVTMRGRSEVQCFGYDGKLVGTMPGRAGIAVFPDGRVAVVAPDAKAIQIYDADFRPLRTLQPPAEMEFLRGVSEDRLYLDTDAQGRLYSSGGNISTSFVRWTRDLNEAQIFGPRYLNVHVDFPDTAVAAGTPFDLKVAATGRPNPARTDAWQVFARASDGSDLRWQKLPSTLADGALRVTPPASLRGLYEVAVRFGDGPIARADYRNDPFLQKTFAFMPTGATQSLAVIPATGRRSYQQGEAIPLHIVRRTPLGALATTDSVQLELLQNNRSISTMKVPVAMNYAGAIPAAVTWRLAPGHYIVRPTLAGYESYALPLDIAPAQNDSPMQRIMYHEFGNNVFQALDATADLSERMATLRNWAQAAQLLGFTRETVRDAGAPAQWWRQSTPVNMVNPGFAPPEYYNVSQNGLGVEAYLDQATKFGLSMDAQIIGHCGAVRCGPQSLADLDAVLQWQAQNWGRYPSFYGFNFNDEMFVNSPWGGLQKSDTDFFNEVKNGKLKGQPDGKVNEYVMNVMYNSFNSAVKEANPNAKTTTTPMWQYPAVEGSYPPSIYKNMDESYSHWISEGYSLPWYPAHSVDNLKRPGKPMMGVFDNLYDSSVAGELYLKNVMQVAARGVQGTGAQHTQPFADPMGAFAYKTANDLAMMYGSIFASTPPANEAAVLYSQTQDYTEKRFGMGTPHWERVFALYGAGLMAGVPMSITYEEDVANGWLLEGKKPRVPMLFLVGQKEKLPEKVRHNIEAFQAAGGKIFTDADSAPFAGATKTSLKAFEIAPLALAGYAADSASPLMQPSYEKLAAELKKVAAKDRRFALDTDDPWVSKNRFNGWAVQYVMLATETSPYPFDAGSVWGLGSMYNKNKNAYLPKSVTLSMPVPKGVVYDVFEHVLVKPTVAGDRAKLTVDLTTFPGRLYAIAPAALGAPQLKAGVAQSAAQSTVEFSAKIVDTTGKPMAAQVPLRIRLFNGVDTATEIYRGTNIKGEFSGSLPLPATAKSWTLEVSELLGGKSSSLAVASSQPMPALLKKRGDVDVQREDQIRDLLEEANGAMTLVAGDKVLSDEQRASLTQALGKKGVTLKTAAVEPAASAPGVLVVAGVVQNGGIGGAFLGKASALGLFQNPVTANVPGEGRGFVTSLLAPRAMNEDVIALVGGDADGLSKAVKAFVKWLDAKPESTDVTEKSTPVNGRTFPLAGKATNVKLPRLSEAVGVRLSGIAVGADGKHLVVGADGYLKNLALIEDSGRSARVVKAARVGQSHEIRSLWISDDGKQFGASGRDINRFGEALQLVDASGAKQVFAGYGDMGRSVHRFAASSDGNVVVVPGTYGVACWQRDGAGWKEAWSFDYWKQFDKLDWPVSSEAERIPQFHAVIPRGADYTIVAFGELSSQGWVTPENFGASWLAAFDLKTGKELWRFDVPLTKTLTFPTLYASPDSSRVLLQVQMGSWGKETFRFYNVDGGKALGTWDAVKAPTAVAVANGSGLVAEAFEGRLVEVRRPNGTIVWNVLWPNQPTSLAFAPDGQSLYLADDSGALVRMDAEGKELWRRDLNSVAQLAADNGKVYAACWNGRVISFSDAGQKRWSLDCTPAMNEKQPMTAVLASAKVAPDALHELPREATTSNKVPTGENLLKSGTATLTLGGTGGWMSGGLIREKPEDAVALAKELTNGVTDDVDEPWLNLDEMFWDGQAGRQVWAQVEFKQPTDVHSLTVYENPKKPASWPSEGVVQVWDEAAKGWKTATHSVFMNSAVNTYDLNLKGVTKLRYVPWNSYYRNFYTSEIEVR